MIRDFIGIKGMIIATIEKSYLDEDIRVMYFDPKEYKKIRNSKIIYSGDVYEFFEVIVDNIPKIEQLNLPKNYVDILNFSEELLDGKVPQTFESGVCLFLKLLHENYLEIIRIIILQIIINEGEYRLPFKFIYYFPHLLFSIAEHVGSTVLNRVFHKKYFDNFIKGFFESMEISIRHKNDPAKLDEYFLDILGKFIRDYATEDILRRIKPIFRCNIIFSMPIFNTINNFAENIFHFDPEIRSEICANPDAPKHPSYRFMFIDFTKDEENKTLYTAEIFRESIAENPNAVIYKTEYRKLFFDENFQVRISCLYNPNAVDFEEFDAVLYEKGIVDYLYFDRLCYKRTDKFDKFIKRLNLDQIYRFLDSESCWKYSGFFEFMEIRNKKILAKVASIPHACEFEQYKRFFREKDIKILFNVASNISAPKFEEYKKLFNHKSYKVRLGAASNPNAARFDEFKQLFEDPSFEVRRAAYFNKNADKYQKFIPDWYFPRELGDDCELIAADPDAVIYPEYEKLFFDPSEYILRAVASNEAAAAMQGYRNLFKYENARYAIAANQKAVELDEYSELFYTKDSAVKRSIVENPAAVRHPLYSLFFFDEEDYHLVTRNVVAVFHPLFKSMFFNKNYDARYALNKFWIREKYPELFSSLCLYSLSTPFALKKPDFSRFFKGKNRAPSGSWRYIKDIAQNIYAINYPGFEKIRSLDEYREYVLKNDVTRFLRDLEIKEGDMLLIECEKFVNCPSEEIYKEVNQKLAESEFAVNIKGFEKLFSNKEFFPYLALNRAATKFDEYKKLFYFKPAKFISDKVENPHDKKIKENTNRNIALNPNAVRFWEFNRLFFSNDYIVLANLASNPNAVDYSNYKRFYFDLYWSVRDAAYHNSKAREKYADLHKRLIPRELGSSIEEIISHKDAQKYEEYKHLIYDKDPKLREALAGLDILSDYEMELLFLVDPTEEILLRLVSNRRTMELEVYESLFYSDSERVLLKLVEVDNVFRYKNSSLLFRHQYESIRIKVALREDAVEHEDYKLLFNDESEAVRVAAASNPYAAKRVEYSRLFGDSSAEVIKAVFSNKYSRELDEFPKVFLSKSYEIREYLAGLTEGLKYEGFRNILMNKHWNIRRKALKLEGVRERFPAIYRKLFPVEWGDNYRLIIFKEEAEEYEEFRMLFTDEMEEIRMLMASHPSISKYEEASILFEDESINVRQRVAANEEAVKLKGFEKLFSDVAEVRKYVASNIAAVKFPEFRQLFSDSNVDVLRRLAVNWNAVNFKEYEKLFESKYDVVRCWILKNFEARRKYPEKCKKLMEEL
ncbi:MAG: hypothetical protein ACTSRZ_18270 [Promethearchaeota archaeon]